MVEELETSRISQFTELALSKLQKRLISQQGSSTLNLGDAFIGDQNCAFLASYLQQNPKIHNLELRGNNLTSEGIRTLSSAFFYLQNLKFLSLEWNSLQNHLNVLVEALKQNQGLKVLDIRNNRIGPEGVFCISRLLENIPGLQKIDFRWNQLGAAGGQTLLQAVRKPSGLQSIELLGNKIPQDIIQGIQAALSGENQSFFPRFEPKEDQHSKYESAMISNARKESKINELELILDQERRRSQDLRADLIREIENEKAKRQYTEQALNIIKQQTFKREMEENRLRQDLEGHLTRANKQRSSLRLEIETLQQEFSQLSYTFQQSNRSGEEKQSKQQMLYRQLEENSKQTIERLKKDHLEYLQELQLDFHSRLNTAEQNYKLLKQNRDTLDLENKSLKQQIQKLKQVHQEQLVHKESLIRQEEREKHTFNMRAMENKIKTVEEGKEMLNKKCQDLQRDMMRGEQENRGRQMELENAIVELKQERADLSVRLQKAGNNIDTLTNEIEIIDSQLKRANAEKVDLNSVIQQRQQVHMQKLESIFQEQTLERKDQENVKQNLTQRVQSLEEELNRTIIERDLVLKEYSVLAETIKQRALSCIQDTVSAHVLNLENSLAQQQI